MGRKRQNATPTKPAQAIIVTTQPAYANPMTQPAYAIPMKAVQPYKRYILIGLVSGLVLSVALFNHSFIKSANTITSDYSLFELLTNFKQGLSSELSFANLISNYSIPQIFSDINEFQPGHDLFTNGNITAKHPVVFIPGIVSTGLEVWNTNECAMKYFRKRLWGTVNQARALLLDKTCWLKHMMLDPITGLDPQGVKLRAALGLEAADYLFPGFWDSNNMFLASYDWRLAYSNLELRDQYYSRLKATIEIAFRYSKTRVLVVTHSMGSNVFFHFMQWVSSAQGGNDTGWCDKYLHSWSNIGGPLLGIPKRFPSVISGETRDTAQLNTFGAYILDQFFNRRDRAFLFRTWGGLASLAMKVAIKFSSLKQGGNMIWGNETWAPDDLINTLGNSSYGTLIQLDNGELNITAKDIRKFMNGVVEEVYLNAWDMEYANHVATSQEEIDSASGHPETWLNPLIAPLPTFSASNNNFKVYCMYGVEQETERKYFYSDLGSNQEDGMRYRINTSLEIPALNVVNGVLHTMGDATVPLISLGYMCSSGWKTTRYNPSRRQSINREYKDGTHELNIAARMTRGGGKSADHVDIMGNVELINDLLHIAAGVEQRVAEDRIHSRIQDISQRVELPVF